MMVRNVVTRKEK